MTDIAAWMQMLLTNSDDKDDEYLILVPRKEIKRTVTELKRLRALVAKR